jgi:integrase
LRKACATRLANAGCTTEQIKAFTGHKTLSEVARYTKAADQERNAKQALANPVREVADKVGERILETGIKPGNSR